MSKRCKPLDSVIDWTTVALDYIGLLDLLSPSNMLYKNLLHSRKSRLPLAVTLTILCGFNLLDRDGPLAPNLSGLLFTMTLPLSINERLDPFSLATKHLHEENDFPTHSWWRSTSVDMLLSRMHPCCWSWRALSTVSKSDALGEKTQSTALLNIRYMLGSHTSKNSCELCL